MTALRICFVGDSLINGTNDEEFQGWPGRLCAAECARGHELTYYNLGVRAETSEQIEMRWRAECEPRLLDIHPGALVFSFGVNDMAIENSGEVRVSRQRSLEVAKKMLGQAQQWKPTLWIGPVPVDETQQPFQSAPGVAYHFSTGRMAELCRDYETLAAEMGIPYLKLIEPLAGEKVWQESFRQGDGVHPAGPGYQLMADRISTWTAWRNWLD
ncbi:MAG: lipase [Rhodospirillaceae bacterium]|jgi:acyl-CoA thioesterase I|nr:lipase [Rhodospirillaceae bacterium]MBT5243518.1 lipase [Rhodospirillaceae bacterium]MBT5562106.1 lipase [Rhodospirillaceae bacterium]MBT6242279.1 lipase [Rhodospirillaceae bacterium]MBT7136897.1 lipase [Rhodospirillaceae bacterium]